MKPISTPVQQKDNSNYAIIFITSIGISYALVNQFVYNKPNIELVVIMICLLSISIFSKGKSKHNK